MKPTLVSLNLLLWAIINICHISISKSEENIDPEIKTRIDEFIKNVVLPQAGVSSLGLAIVRNDDQKILYTTGYGMANQEKQIPNGNETQFLIGSITKSLTATIAAKVLSERFPELGEAVLDTPIRKLIPSANFTLIDRFRSEHGTFRDLLSHKMCFLSDDLQMVAEPFNSSAEIVYRQRYAEGVCDARAGFQYNNQMYVVAAELIAHLANNSYENLVQDLLLDIGMLNSSLGKKTDDHASISSRAQPYYMLDNESLPMNTDLLKRLVDSNAAGGLWATPNDMAKYMEFHLNLGKIGEKQVVPESVMKWLRHGVNVVPMNSFKTAEDDIVVNLQAYGLGLMSATYDGWEYLQHSGFYGTYESWLSLFPSQNLAIFSTSNQAPFAFDSMILHSFIFETLERKENIETRISRLIGQTRAEQTEKQSRQAKLHNNFLQQFGRRNSNAQTFTKVIGVYGSGSSGDVEILEKFNQDKNITGLYISYGKWAHGWLETYDSADNADVINLKVFWDSDIIQELYATGDKSEMSYARVYNDTLEFIGPGAEEVMVYGRFKLGVSLDKLPPIPWTADSC